MIFATPFITPRLTLVPATAAHVAAELAGRDAFAACLGAGVPASWPPGEYDESAQCFFLDCLTRAARVRARVMMNNHLSGAVSVQYNSASDAVSAKVRVRYTQREGNDLYIVLNNGLNTDRNALSPARPLTDTRSLLIKYSRTFDLGF